MIEKSPDQNNLLLICVLIFIGMLVSLSTDMYVPAMPMIAHALNSTTKAVQLSISIFLLTASCGVLIYGPLSDSFGRKKTLLIGVSIGTIGTICCLLASSVHMLLIGRFLQGCGFASIGINLISIARDIFNNQKFAQIASILSMIFGLGPIASPILGGYITHLFGWHSIFALLTVYAVICIMAIIFLIPEIHHKINRPQFNIWQVASTYCNIFKNETFLKNAISKSIPYAGFMIFFTVTPFMLQSNLKLNPIEYGWITLLLTGFIFFAKLSNTILLKYVSIRKLIIISNFSLLAAGIALFSLALLHYYSIWSIIAPFILFAIGSGFLFSNATVAAFKPIKKSSSGSAAGALNGLSIMTGFVGSAIAAHLSIDTLLPLGVLIMSLGVVVVVQYALLKD